MKCKVPHQAREPVMNPEEGWMRRVVHIRLKGQQTKILEFHLVPNQVLKSQII
jgi:hypothetical protein